MQTKFWAGIEKQISAGVEEFLVVLAVKRPFNVLGANNPWELLTYRVCFDGNSEQLSDDVPVHAPLMIKSTCPAMLRSVSGIDQNAEVIPISFIGCGSLGSKMALHLAKSYQVFLTVLSLKRTGPALNLAFNHVHL